ncbi:MAG TPA: tetratricopeptide repeat protein, partial [Longimicrobiales bacterium]|nr:tetratricopeptide repeat protein [Longimicrobiales bacterium]
MPSFESIKQRKIVQWTAAYLAASWLLMQVVGWLANAYGWPNEVLRALPILLGGGLLAVVVVAWYHGERGAQRVSRTEAALLGLVTTIVFVSIAFVVPGKNTARIVAATKATDVQQASIAVLPFVNMSGDRENEYFSDGITEELLNVLTQLNDLRVAARTSSFAFKGRNIPVARIADSLNVQHVLEGSVRKAGNKVRITAQLINARNGYHVWSNAYDRELKDVFAVQEEIAREIAQAMQVQLSARSAPQVRGATNNIEAHELYLLGLHHWNRRTPVDIEKAISYFSDAVARDSSYALAWAGLANAYTIAPFYTNRRPDVVIPQARNAIDRAMRLDSKLAEPYATLGDIALHFERDFAKGAKYLRHSLELNPNYATAHTWYGEVLGAHGDLTDAERELAKAYDKDPLSPRIVANYAFVIRHHDPARAEKLLRRAIDMAPDFWHAHTMLVTFLIERQR